MKSHGPKVVEAVIPEFKPFDGEGKKQKPPKKMTEQERKERALRDSKAIQSAKLR